jgi:hypothetical protein
MQEKVSWKQNMHIQEVRKHQHSITILLHLLPLPQGQSSWAWAWCLTSTVLRLRISTAIPPFPLYALMACAGTTLSLPLQFCWQHFLVWQIFRKKEQIYKFPTLQNCNLQHRSGENHWPASVGAVETGSLTLSHKSQDEGTTWTGFFFICRNRCTLQTW